MSWKRSSDELDDVFLTRNEMAQLVRATSAAGDTLARMKSEYRDLGGLPSLQRYGWVHRSREA
jgi:hypothetical protein